MLRSKKLNLNIREKWIFNPNYSFVLRKNETNVIERNFMKVNELFGKIILIWNINHLTKYSLNFLIFLLNDSCLKKSVCGNYFFELSFGQVMGQDLDFDINWLVAFHLGRYFDEAFKVINHNLFLTCESFASLVGKVIEQGLFFIYDVI